MIVYFDGGCSPNPGMMEACVVMCPPIGKPQIHKLADLGQGTSNLAEWAALILAVTLLQDIPGKVVILGDSKLVVNQAQGLWKINQERMRDLATEYKRLTAGMEIELNYVARDRNLAGRYLEHGHL